MSDPDKDLVAKFDAEMRGLHQRTVAETDYRPTYFIQMVHERGGLGAARALLHAAKPAAGLTTLWEKGPLDLSVEAVILRAPWSALFTDQERATARKRLHDLGYTL